MSMQVCSCGSGKRPTGYCSECHMSYCNECKFTHLYNRPAINIGDLLQAEIGEST